MYPHQASLTLLWAMDVFPIVTCISELWTEAIEK